MKGDATKDWLQEELEQKALRQKVIARRIAERSAQLSGKSLPKPKPLPIKLKKSVQAAHHKLLKLIAKLSRKQLGYVGILLALLVAVSLLRAKFSRLPGSKITKDHSKSQAVQKPEFNTVLPANQPGGSTAGKIGYDAIKKVASYTDKIGTVSITVSQQPLPESFKTNPDEELKKLAEGFSATKTIAEANPKAYLGTSAKGPQTVILQKQGLLIFISSSSRIDESEWAKYVNELN